MSELAVAVVQDDVRDAEQHAQDMGVQAVGDHHPPGGEQPAAEVDPPLRLPVVGDINQTPDLSPPAGYLVSSRAGSGLNAVRARSSSGRRWSSQSATMTDASAGTSAASAASMSCRRSQRMSAVAARGRASGPRKNAMSGHRMLVARNSLRAMSRLTRSRTSSVRSECASNTARARARPSLPRK